MNADLHLFAGAYALDALDTAERIAFEEHLDECESCASEAAGMRATAALLGAAATTTPSAAFHDAVLAEVRRTRQHPPLNTGSTATPSSSADTSDQAAVIPLLRRAQQRSRALLAVAAALVVLAGGLGTLAVQQLHRAQQAQQTSTALAAVLAAPDARTVDAQGVDGSRARAVVSLTTGTAVFIGTSLPRIDKNQALQLWVITDGRATSAGLVDGTTPVLAHGLTAGASLGVTVEPAGGSKQPTTTPVVTLPVA